MAKKMVILGGGPGGYAAAFEAAERGAEVTLVERRRLGGTCLNVGCIPTKTILRTAAVINETVQAGRLGLIDIEPARVDVDRLRVRKEGVVDELVGQIVQNAKRLKVEVVYGEGTLVTETTIEVKLEQPAEDGSSTKTFVADAIILATGSVPLRLPGIDHTLKNVWTSDDAVALKEIPAEIIIIGGGVIGVEFACAYASFGCKVSVVELSESLLPGNDKRVTRTLAGALKEQGIDLYLKTSVDKVEEIAPDRVRATLSNGETLDANVLMSAVGRIPNTQGFGFAEVGIEFDRRAVKVNEFFQTNKPNIYAVGDAIAGMMLAHVAEAEGIAAARNALNALENRAPEELVDLNVVPGCVYTFPEVGVVGMTADKAKAQGVEAVTGVAKYAGNGKALSAGEKDGFAQIVAEKSSGRILGAQIVGAEAVELITEVSNAMCAGVTVGQLGSNVFAHPTLSEVVKAAALVTASKLS
ncbi:MAG: dihydrolipoyl dehydrogenase [Coriobacteriia bacterium]|nr:dihydrolipoyl dehydrogenase [Coriobacteriia bacterium]